jgi:DNA ligase-1
MRERMGESGGREYVLPFRKPAKFRSFEIELLPAGHVLGSAQSFIQSEAGSLLYTGDFKLRAGLSSERAQPVRAETLVMETTYGLPRYVFPPAGEVIAQAVKFCLEAREDGVTPVLLGYSLGKAQEILSALVDAGLPILLHNSVWSMTRIYETMGVKFPPHEKFAPELVAGHVVICPPGASLRGIPHRRTACLTGWAMDSGAIHRMQVDAAFPLSDHADYDELMRYVELVQPKRVLTLHGFAREFARDLRAKGIEAWALTGADQLELPIAAAKPPPKRRRTIPIAEPSGFSAFAALCDEIAASTGKLAKIRLLANYLQKLSATDLPLAATWLTGRAFSQAAARPLHLGWAIIRRALLTVSGLSPSDLQAISRRNNDPGLTTEEALASNPQAAAASLEGIHEFFERVESARGPVAKTALLEKQLRGLGAREARTLVKILTGDLRIGLKDGLVEEAIAAAFDRSSETVREAHMLLGDLGDTARRARNDALRDVELQPFRPVKCMLASPEPTAAAIWERMTEEENTSEVWLEDKLDGIRAQLHCAEGRVAIYSRDLRDVTASFSEIAAGALAVGEAFVLDGEIVAWRDGKPLPFFELQKRLGRIERDLFMSDEVPVSFTAFDLLWLNSQSIFREPLATRRKLLEEISLVAPLQILPIHNATSAVEIDAAFDAARSRDNEGLIAKSPKSSYAPGRRGMAWIKLKKAFATLDVVVVSVEYGHGKRKAVLSDYTFAVRGEGGELLNIGKAYSGLTDAEIAMLTARFQKSIVRQRGRVFDVRPEVVLEVAFDSIQPSTRHASGLAMRFPRIHRIREDKSPAEIDAVSTARRLAGL